MKKIIVFLFISTLLIFFSKNSNSITIPKDSIRFRIIANSNSEHDQKEKWMINYYLFPTLSTIIGTSNTIDDTRYLINNNLSTMKNVINKYNQNNSINFGYNYFPKKEYKNIEYEEGYYESLVITLGEGKGDNWWCVLFPPLCFLDEDLDNIEYDSYIKNIINKYI